MQIVDDIRNARQSLAELSASADPTVRAEREAELAGFEAEARAELRTLNKARRQAWEAGNLAADERTRRAAKNQMQEIDGRAAEIKAALGPEASTCTKTATATAEPQARTDAEKIDALHREIYDRRNSRQHDQHKAAAARGQNTTKTRSLDEIARDIYGE
jgi:hypothetical protein